MPEIVIASDSFKGSLSSSEAARSIEYGLKSVSPYCRCRRVSVADGGEGTVEALKETLGGHTVKCIAHDPLMRQIEVSYAILGDGRTAVLEMAAASGLTLLSESERNPLRTTTFGTGEMILDALENGCTRFLVGIGGSATNDAGMGAFSALGYRFIEGDGTVLPGCGESLAKVSDIDFTLVHPRLKDAVFTIACDVDTPFCRPEGAAFVFSPQKGASSDEAETLDRGLAHFASVVKKLVGRDIEDVPGAGAAGGLGGGFLAFSDAVLKPGVEMVLDAIGFDQMLDGADAVITGEGRIDGQTFRGKTPYGVMKRARAKGIPVYAIGGCVALDGVDGISPYNGLWNLGAYSGCGFDCIVPAVSGKYDPEYVMRGDIAGKNVASAAASLADVFFKG